MLIVASVTNHHVAVASGCSTVRVNMKNGETDIFEFEPHEWHFDPRYDAAVIPLQINNSKHKYSLIPFKGLQSREDIARLKIGPGDDVFMAGRFVDHDGGARNVPAIRFGHVSVNPSPLMYQGRLMDTYCVDVHSRTGHSGSPVFVYRMSGHDLELNAPQELAADTPIFFAGKTLLAVLGIHYAQFPERWEIAKGTPGAVTSVSEAPLTKDGDQVIGMSGMTCVLPSYCIREVFELPKIKAMLAAGEAQLEQEIRQGAAQAPTAETAGLKAV